MDSGKKIKVEKRGRMAQAGAAIGEEDDWFIAAVFGEDAAGEEGTWPVTTPVVPRVGMGLPGWRKKRVKGRADFGTVHDMRRDSVCVYVKRGGDKVEREEGRLGPWYKHVGRQP